MQTSTRERIVWAMLIVACLLLLPCGVINHGDGAARYAHTRALLRGSYSIPDDLRFDAKGQPVGGILPGNGGWYSKYGVGTSLVWTVPVGAALAMHRFTGIDLNMLAGFGISFVNPIAVAVTGLSIWNILLRLGAPLAVRRWSVVFYLVGCSTLAYANTAFSEPVAALLILWAVALPIASKRITAHFAAGLMLAFATTIKVEFAFLWLCVTPAAFRRGRWQQTTAFTLAAALGPAWLLFENWICRGNLLQFSYGGESSQFGSPLRGLYGYFIGVDRNLILFNVAIISAVIGWLYVRPTSESWRRFSIAVASIWVVYLPFYASWWAWEGGMCFGPRFFQSFMPITLLPAAIGMKTLLDRNRVVFAAVAVAIIVTLPLQIAGLEVKNEEAAHVADAMGISEVRANVELLALKIVRGPKGNETYTATDFWPKVAPTDRIDFRDKRTFQYLNNWWAIALANHVRRGQ